MVLLLLREGRTTPTTRTWAAVVDELAGEVGKIVVDGVEERRRVWMKRDWVMVGRKIGRWEKVGRGIE